METDKLILTVYFEDPFWVGVFEKIENGKLSVCKITFGAEPKDYEIQAFILRHYYELQFGNAVKVHQKQSADNPKRRQRNVKKQLREVGIGTKSQQALAKQREEKKTERKIRNKEEKQAEMLRKREQKTAKKKEKHRGH